MMATLIAAVGVIALVMLGGMCLRGILQGIQPDEWTMETVVGILAWISAGIIHGLFVSQMPGWGVPLYIVLIIPTILMAVGWRYANTSTLRGWIVPLLCCSLAVGGLGYGFGAAAAPRRLALYASASTAMGAPPATFGVIDQDTGALWLGATMKDVREYYEWYSNRAAALGVLIGLAAGGVICRCRGAAPRSLDARRESFLNGFPDEQPSLESGENSEHIRGSSPDVTREPPGALTDSETASEG